MQILVALAFLFTPKIVWSMFTMVSDSKKIAGFRCHDETYHSIEHANKVVQFAMNLPPIHHLVYGPFPFMGDTTDKIKNSQPSDFGALLSFGTNKLLSAEPNLEWPVEWVDANWDRNLSFSQLHYIIFNEKGKVLRMYYYNNPDRRRMECTPEMQEKLEKSSKESPMQKKTSSKWSFGGSSRGHS